MSVRPGGRDAGAGRRRSGAAARRSLSATRRPHGTGRSGPRGSRSDSGSASRSTRRATRNVAPRAGQRRLAMAVVRSPLARQIVALGLALAVVALSLAYPLRGYLQQQAAEQQAVSDQHELEGQISDLKAQAAALKDPAYIRAEAKRRLQYVTPGDTVYVVTLPPGVTPDGRGPDPAGPAQTPGSTTLGSVVSGTLPADTVGGTGTAKSSGTAKATGGATSDNTLPPAVDPAAPTTRSAASSTGAGEPPAGSADTPWYSSMWDTLRGDHG